MLENGKGIFGAVNITSKEDISSMNEDFKITPELSAHFSDIVDHFNPYQELFAGRVDALNQKIIAEADEAYENKQRLFSAMEATAQNTAEANAQLNTMVNQQMDHIRLLQDAKQTLEQQLDTQQTQLRILKGICTSTEVATAVEKEIMRLIAEQVDEKHPLWEYVEDKGGDALVAYGPVLLRVFRLFLITKGTIF